MEHQNTRISSQQEQRRSIGQSGKDLPQQRYVSSELLDTCEHTEIIGKYAPKHLAQYEASVADNVFTFLETLKQLVKAYGHMLNIAPICERMVFDAREHSRPQTPVS